MKKLGRKFFEKDAIELAGALLGTIMVRRVGRIVRRARITEVEAYLGPKDLASHSSKGRTERTEVMFGDPGRAYVYYIYGMHWMFNIVCGVRGEAHAVLIRGATPLDGWEADLSGPAKLAKAFEITRAENGLDLTRSDICFHVDSSHHPSVKRSRRIGVHYAKHWKNRLLRFVDTKGAMGPPPTRKPARFAVRGVGKL